MKKKKKNLKKGRQGGAPGGEDPGRGVAALGEKLPKTGRHSTSEKGVDGDASAGRGEKV